MKKTVLITGASTGIGVAAARVFAGNDWNVIATMRQPAADSELARLPDVSVTRLDVQDRESIDAAVADGVERFGRIDALINNAGFSLFGVFEAISREKIQEQFDVNIFGLMDVTRALLPHFRRNKSGLIINISSRAGLVGLPMISLYCAAKYALEGFSEALAYELASQSIVIKIVEPSGGVTGTREWPRKRLLAPRRPITPNSWPAPAPFSPPCRRPGKPPRTTWPALSMRPRRTDRAGFAISSARTLETSSRRNGRNPTRTTSFHARALFLLTGNGGLPRNCTAFSPVKSRDFTVKVCNPDATRRRS
jgi:NAD(P)-dependent dehydrogenase (short-subunit alcohol dehydrogenase family)